MAQPYVGEIRMFAGNFAPAGWLFCEGQLVSIAEHETLFVLIGTTYGGDGQSTFALPDLRGRVPVHMGQGVGLTNYPIGARAGVERAALTTAMIPSHSHGLHGSRSLADDASPQGRVFAKARTELYAPAQAPLAAPPVQVTSTGGQPHENRQPYLCMNFIISLYGIFPSQT